MAHITAILLTALSFASSQSSTSLSQRAPEASTLQQTGNARQESQAPDLLATAHERFTRLTREDNDTAIAIYQGVLGSGPSVSAYAGLAEAFAQRFYWNRSDRSAFDSALEMANKALVLDARSPQAHFARAFSLGVAGRPREAADEYIVTLQIDPDYPRAADLALGQFWRAGLYEQAYRWATRQAAREPRSLEVLFNYGVACGFLIETEQSERIWKHALEIDPTFGTAYGELAFLAQARGNAEEAVAQFEAAVKAEPTDLSNQGGLAQMLIPAGHAARARELLERVIAANRTARAYGGRSALTIYGWALSELGEREAASRAFDEMLNQLAAREQSGETTYQLYRERAAIQAIRGNRAEALRAARQAVNNGWHLYGSWQMPDPMFRSLAGNTEFEGLLERMRGDTRSIRERAGLSAK